MKEKFKKDLKGTYAIQYLQFHPSEIEGPIKIGQAADVQRRVRELQQFYSHGDLWILAWNPEKNIESELHELLGEYISPPPSEYGPQFEWLHPHPTVLETIYKHLYKVPLDMNRSAISREDERTIARAEMEKALEEVRYTIRYETKNEGK